MRISKIAITNFRSVEHIELELSETTVIIGENNSGKSSLLDAIRIALSRRWGRSGSTGFSEFDFRSAEDGAALPITVDMTFEEQFPNQWPQEVTIALNDIVRTDVQNELNSIRLKVDCTFESVTKSVDPDWQFLNEQGHPYRGRGGRNQNLNDFFGFVPCFSMAAVRDASGEFGSRSAFWMPLLKSVEIEPDRATDLEAQFARLNDELLEADPKIESIKASLGEISRVIAKGAAGSIDVRAIPPKLWDVIRRSELVVQGRDQDPWLPVARHGQGVQSLSIIFGFRAFVENVLRSANDRSEPILCLEEPEAHLHPQACRALWRAIERLPGQKVVTTHSPYFVQHVPFKDLVILRRTNAGPRVFRIVQKFTLALPECGQLRAFAAANAGKFSYDPIKGELECRGYFEEEEKRRVLMCYTDRRELHAAIAGFMKVCASYISDDDITKLESWAKRIRGEIFFARKWILCEGQAEYAILHAVGDQLGVNFDAHGIAVIDYQNNGSPGAFASLARSLGFDWVMLCDGDDGGDDHVAQLRSRKFDSSEIGSRVFQLAKGVDLEKFLYESSFRDYFVAGVTESDPSCAIAEIDLLNCARNNKEQVASRVAQRIRVDDAGLQTPAMFVSMLQRLGELE